ncbi:hypothetical protein N752_07715 [Desulforamulus aquiferis]|nr:GntR family transcriptional regulator [Desulforamulus aquiferis]RYD05771.1 hypothetical protein N752_07715 [Desulforamulus aquiferis]
MPIPTKLPIFTRISAKDYVLNQIQEWIIDGTFQPGEKLYDGQLADALGVSRTPVREALKTLQDQGFIEMLPGKETRVTKIKDEDIFKIFAPLGALQSLAAELATPLIDQKTIIYLRDLNSKIALAISEENSFDALKLDEQFHQRIVELTDNQYISSMNSILQAHGRRLYFLKSVVLAHTCTKDHEEIICAFERQDKEAAGRIMKQNWLQAAENFYGLNKDK